MSDEEKTRPQKLDRIGHLEKMVQEIHTYLVGGNKLKGGKPGMVDVVDANTKDIDKLETRVGDLEKLGEHYKKVRSYAAVFVSTAVLTILVSNFIDAIKSIVKSIFK